MIKGKKSFYFYVALEISIFIFFIVNLIYDFPYAENPFNLTVSQIMTVVFVLGYLVNGLDFKIHEYYLNHPHQFKRLTKIDGTNKNKK